MTQSDRVLRHLRDNKTITTLEAIQEYGITRLSARIYILRKEGHTINDEWIEVKNRYGERSTYKKYILED